MGKRRSRISGSGKQKDRAVQRKTFLDRLLDPMHYGALLKAFDETGPLSSGRQSAVDIEALDETTLPALSDSLSNDQVFAALKNCSEA